ncbi:MAG: mannitol dehydrogenase family protein [Pontibacterium sp.]
MTSLTYKPAVDVGHLNIGIVHIGLGAFHRAHQAVYIQSFINRTCSSEWGICSTNIRSNVALVEQLQAADHSYHVIERPDTESATAKQINSIAKTVFAGASKSELLSIMASPSVRIVSLTVTEKGYYLSLSENQLRIDHPDIAHDIQNPNEPKTVPGILLAALVLRKSEGLEPFTVLCCDNMPDNGQRVRQAVLDLAAKVNPGLVDWISRNVAFPNSMVDRIVPAMTDKSAEEAESLLGFTDLNSVICESFSQWVVEDNFPQGRPAWELDGVQMVEDVGPFETMKLRLLNGSHSLMAYVGFLAGFETVSEAVANPTMTDLIRRYMQDEVSPTLVMPEDTDIEGYCNALIKRFGNDSLRHRLDQIATDGSQKIVQRWLLGSVDNLQSGRGISVVALGVASWIHFTKGASADGREWAVNDPLADRFVTLHQSATTPLECVSLFLSQADIFPSSLSNNPSFARAVLDAYVDLEQMDALSCVSLRVGKSIRSGE